MTIDGAKPAGGAGAGGANTPHSVRVVNDIDDLKRLEVDAKSPESTVAFSQLENSGGLFGSIGYKKMKLEFGGRYVTTDIHVKKDDQTQPELIKVAINVNSLSKHLGISKADVKELAQKGKLGSVLETVHETTKSQDKDLEKFFGTTAGQDIAELFTKNALKPGKEMKMGTKTFQLRETVILSKEREELGKGHYGTAYKTEGFSVNSIQCSDYAQKVSNTDPNNPKFAKEARKDLKTEAENLVELTIRATDKGKMDVLDCLQLAPASVSYKGKTGDMSSKVYLGNLQSMQGTMTLDEKLNGVNSLVKALAFVQEEGCVHVDIKAPNVFVDEKEGKKILRLGDFGGARWAKDIKKQKGNFTHTSYYTRMDDAVAMSSKGTDENRLHEIATFQMGYTLFELLSGGKPPFLDGPAHHDRQTGYLMKALTNEHINVHELEGYPDDIKGFILSLIDSDPEKRPTKNQILENWQAIVQQYGGMEKMIEAVKNSGVLQHQAEEALSKWTSNHNYSDWFDNKQMAFRTKPDKCEEALRSMKVKEEEPKFAYTQLDGHNDYVIIGINSQDKFQVYELNDPLIFAGLKEGKNIITIVSELLKNEPVKIEPDVKFDI